jgi:hypothetical protein
MSKKKSSPIVKAIVQTSMKPPFVWWILTEDKDGAYSHGDGQKVEGFCTIDSAQIAVDGFFNRIKSLGPNWALRCEIIVKT